MNIDDKIETICKTISDVTYYFGDWTRANVDLETVKLPVLINLLPLKGGTIIKNGYIKESRNSMFALLDKSGNDDNAIKDNETITRMRMKKSELINALNKSGYFNPIEGEIIDEIALDKLDITITGVVFELKLTEKNGSCIG